MYKRSPTRTLKVSIWTLPGFSLDGLHTLLSHGYLLVTALPMGTVGSRFHRFSSPVNSTGDHILSMTSSKTLAVPKAGLLAIFIFQVSIRAHLVLTTTNSFCDLIDCISVVFGRNAALSIVHISHMKLFQMCLLSTYYLFNEYSLF